MKAEALSQTGDFAGAEEYLNMIRERANVDPINLSGDVQGAEAFRQLSRLKFAREKDFVEREIFRRIGSVSMKKTADAPDAKAVPPAGPAVPPPAKKAVEPPKEEKK